MDKQKDKENFVEIIGSSKDRKKYKKQFEKDRLIATDAIHNSECFILITDPKDSDDKQFFASGNTKIHKLEKMQKCFEKGIKRIKKNTNQEIETELFEFLKKLEQELEKDQ